MCETRREATVQRWCSYQSDLEDSLQEIQALSSKIAAYFKLCKVQELNLGRAVDLQLIF
jgi:hypothetical protein